MSVTLSLLVLFALVVDGGLCQNQGTKPVVVNRIEQTYEPTWESLDTRPLPEWYDKAKVGIFIHWGVYSVPTFGTEWFWTNLRDVKVKSYVEYMQKNFKPGFTYQEFARDFTAEHFNPSEWAKIFAESGAK